MIRHQLGAWGWLQGWRLGGVVFRQQRRFMGVVSHWALFLGEKVGGYSRQQERFLSWERRHAFGRKNLKSEKVFRLYSNKLPLIQTVQVPFMIFRQPLEGQDCRTYIEAPGPCASSSCRSLKSKRETELLQEIDSYEIFFRCSKHSNGVAIV
ncbi:hypothetical protein B0H13DRAFT_1981948 [Mycena leptocephala]|nr:hypothetical protein B0H13DRAFT_1981948 [Mycena leptocephala]